MSDWATIIPFVPPAHAQNNQNPTTYSWFMYCLFWVQTGYGQDWSGFTAIESWNACPEKFPGQLPPAGVESIVWFTWKQPGHVAVMRGDGALMTSPTKSANEDAKSTVVYPSLQAFLNAHPDMKYLGWSTCLGYDDTRVMYKKSTPPITPTTNRRNNMRFTRDLNQRVFFHTDYGYMHIENGYHLGLLERFVASDATSYKSNPFNAAEITIINEYVTKIRDGYFIKFFSKGV